MRFVLPSCALLLPLLLGAPGCVNVKVEPIHATIDVNLRIDRSLDDFYSYQQPASQPATRAAGAPADTAVVLPSTATQPVEIPK